LVPPEFAVTALPVSDNLGNGSVEFGEKNINAFQVVTIKPKLKALKEGMFSLSPEIKYVDEKGTLKTSKPNPVNITVQPAEKTYEVLPNRVTTGFSELDVLLFGGIPEKFGVVLASPAIEERELLIRRFIKAGINAGEITFHLTVEAASTKVFAEENQANFYLVVCNPQAESIVKSLPNVYKLKGVENLTEIDIALTKAFRTLNPSVKGPRRICVEILSDVLLQHRALATRRWLSALLPTLKAKDFTVLAVVDPQMHPPEEVQAILGLFDGELRVTERETVKGAEKVLRIQKLSGQKYRGGERVLSRQKLEQ
jgi:KaiC/GvpD/RAD55 family RecA-like ATPase